MPSKKRKYNARFPAGRIKKIMQTDEEVGKVAQAVPIIISRTLELFVESLLSKAMQVTLSRNAKTLSPSHVKQCILAESRFDFLRDLVKNIPDVSAAEEKEMMSAESSPNSSRYSDTSVPRRLAPEDSNSSNSSDVKVAQLPRDCLKRALLDRSERLSQSQASPPDETRRTETETRRTETVTSGDIAIDLTKRQDDRPVRTANFYQETLVTDELQPRSVITLNPTYASQPSTSTSTYASLTPTPTPVEVKKVVIPVPHTDPKFQLKVTPTPPTTPNTPILNIDFSKNLAKPEIKVLDTAVANIVGVPKNKLQRQNSKSSKLEAKRPESKPALSVDIDRLNSGNLQIDEDYDT